ncbi:hypothetical protein E3T41_16135 [Cryobacterium sp. Hh38]|nr:hypothetical protein E3T41_16135 [Cryobacterium sp. Hh38]
MNSLTKIRIARTALWALLAFGICLLLFATFIGAGLPSFIVGVAGWIALIAGLIGLVSFFIQKSKAASRSDSWRPADDDER